MQNQLDPFQFLTIVSVSYALVVHFTPCQSQYKTKSVKLESIHDNASFSSSKSHFPPPTSRRMVLRILQNDQLHQMKKSNDIRAQTRSRQLVKLSTEWPIKGKLFTARGFQFVSSKNLYVSSIFLLKMLGNTTTEKRRSFVGRKIHIILWLFSSLH